MIQSHSPLRARLRRLSAVHFLLLLAVVVQIIVFDAGKLIPPEVVLQRWVATGLLAAVVTGVWYAAHNRLGDEKTLKKLAGILIVSDIAFASFATYSQRGMASRAVVLFIIPIIVAAAINRRTAILATAFLCVAAYMGTCVAYFVLNFNEGYKLELYGETGFYAALFIIIGLLLWSLVKPLPTKKITKK